VPSRLGKNPLTNNTALNSTEKTNTLVGSISQFSSTGKMLEGLVTGGLLTLVDKNALTDITREDIVDCLSSFEAAKNVRHPRAYLTAALKAKQSERAKFVSSFEADETPCVDCGQVPHWYSKKCGCTNENTSETSPTEDPSIYEIVGHANFTHRALTAKESWDATYNQLELRLDKNSFDTYLRRTKLLSLDDGFFVIGVANESAQDFLRHRFYRNVRRVLSDVIGRVTELRFVVDESCKVGMLT